ncbi:MAG: ribonuclease activity regulator RraA [Chloroflexi bacterium]|nr:ribonuclease activity regulator RraA [Chloroflexota bacterium]
MLQSIPSPDISLPIHGKDIQRPSPDLTRQLYGVSSATASAILHKMGVQRTFIQGPISRKPGAKVVGPAVTLQFMPQREDVASGMNQEYIERTSALWHVLDHIEAGDILAVQAYGDPNTGCLGEMLITYLKGRGGIGLVVDGAVRDWPKVKEIDIPLWVRGVTPNYSSQARLYPWAYNVPIACSQSLVLPGDIIIADDDGAVVVPVQLAELVLEETREHEDWEAFSRMKLAEGGPIWTYYPLSEEGQQEYEAWRAEQDNS